jgi:hypothetical protein
MNSPRRKSRKDIVYLLGFGLEIADTARGGFGGCSGFTPVGA